jgi:conjugal transfer pilus assembly protein TrbC
MKNAFPLTVGISLATAAAFAAVSAQESYPGLDLEAIRARAGEHTADAEALATNVRTRANALAESARETSDEARQARTSYAADVVPNGQAVTLDLDAMVRSQAEAERTLLGQSPRFIAFVSLSLPPQALKTLVADVARAGGVSVLRGFPQGDSALFKRRLTAIWHDGSEASKLGIDPRLFRAFHIEAVPSFVMLGADFSPCDGFACTDQLPPHDRIAGNVSVAHVLETFAAGHGPGAPLAAAHLARLEGEQR